LSTGFGGGVPRMQRWNSPALRLAQGLSITWIGGRGSGRIGNTQVSPIRTVPARQGSTKRHAPSSNRVPGGHVGFTTITGGLLSTGLGGSGRGGVGKGGVGLLIGNGAGGAGFGFGQFW